MYFKLIFLTILLFGVAIGYEELKSDYTHYDKGIFKYYGTRKTWNDARLYCHRRGAMLASPTTIKIRNVMKYILEVVRNKDDIFTGIHSSYKKEYYSSLDGVPLSAMPRSWVKSGTDNETETEKCIALNYFGDMSYAKCTETKPFICYEEYSANECGTLDSEYTFDSRTDKCYKFHKSPRDFKEANMACYAEGGYLAIINSEVEAEVIRDIFRRNHEESIPGNFWKAHAFIGFLFWGENSNLMTIHGQTLQEAGYYKFEPGQPDQQNSGEYCGAVGRGGLLNDVQCSYAYTFICEKNLTPHSVS